MNDNELKIAALKERMGQIVTEYEEKVADLRVIVTNQQHQLEHLESQLAASQAGSPGDEDASGDVIEGEVL